MKQFAHFIALSFFLNALAFAQETPQQTQTVPADSIGAQPPAANEKQSTTEENSQQQSAAQTAWTIRDYLTAAALGLSLFGFLFGLYQYRRRVALEKEKTTAQEQAKFEFQQRVKEQVREEVAREAQEKARAELLAREQHEQQKQQKKIQTSEEAYLASLRDELGSISLLGSPEVRNLPLNLIDCFVNLDLSERWHSEEAPLLGEEREMLERERDYPPEKAIERALRVHKTRLLLIIGDPGSGKTTLLKHYALKCLDDKHQEFGFDAPRLPIYLPLRNVDPDKSLAANLAEREKTRPRPLSEDDIDAWLVERDTLILFDGLDEVSEIDERIEICRWIEEQCRSFRKAFFVVTSRWTGYRKADGVELEIKHLRADVRDFSHVQQKEFLQKWFDAVYLCEDLPDGEPDEVWKAQRLQQAWLKAQAIIEYLERDENESLRHLAAIPMLLQIMAIIWKEQEYLPRSRATLYNVALNYLLEHRDRHRKLYPILSAEHARSALAPAAMWMQEELHTEEVEKEKLHEQLQPALDEMEEQPAAKDFCENLRDRAGVIADYGKNEYIFRHKSFREYLAGMQLAELFQEEGRLQRLVKAFGDDWWEEPLRFFISKPNGKLFDGFMRELFRSPKSRRLGDKQQDLLRLLVQEAGQRKIDALVACLNDSQSTEIQRRYVLDCLKIIGTEQALNAVKGFVSREKTDTAAVKLGRQILLEQQVETPELTAERIEVFKTLPPSFHNPIEYNAEYILLKGGTFTFQKGKELEAKKPVPDIYFAKYPVTNKRYRRFIRYLQGEEPDLLEQIPLKIFAEKLLNFADSIKDFRKFLGEDSGGWAEKLKSEYDDNRKFNGDDQPVVGVSWFATRAYCFWLSVFEAAQSEVGLAQPVEKIAEIYRLPKEIEWERAAAGLEGEKDAPRIYPWGKDEPDEKRANFGRNVGATTPVGRYPEGATPEDLMDMAGNVWEWQENWYDDQEKKYRSLRGGSWDYSPEGLACAVRVGVIPDFGVNVSGFRVVRPQSSF